jgi:NAD(P)-dependent dehydrogenase (short-subunit alcohol dehydrogenase family)
MEADVKLHIMPAINDQMRDRMRLRTGGTANWRCGRDQWRVDGLWRRRGASAAKGAIAIFTKSATLQYAKENIRINLAHPGWADTPLTEKRFSDSVVRQGCSTAHRWVGSAPPRISPMGAVPGVRRVIFGHQFRTGHRWRHDSAVA